MGMIEDTEDTHPHPTLPLKGRDLVSTAHLALPLKWRKCTATQTGIDHGNQVAQQQT
jgi:hypothetical protein